MLSYVILASFADELLSHVPCKHIKNKIWRYAFGKLLVQHCRYVLATLSAMTEIISPNFFVLTTIFLGKARNILTQFIW